MEGSPQEKVCQQEKGCLIHVYSDTDNNSWTHFDSSLKKKIGFAWLPNTLSNWSKTMNSFILDWNPSVFGIYRNNDYLSWVTISVVSTIYI